MTDFKSNVSNIVAFSITSDVTTDTATGTSWSVFSVLVAVTITSSIVLSCEEIDTEKIIKKNNLN